MIVLNVKFTKVHMLSSKSCLCKTSNSLFKWLCIYPSKYRLPDDVASGSGITQCNNIDKSLVNNFQFRAPEAAHVAL